LRDAASSHSKFNSISPRVSVRGSGHLELA
jgi:hypothetical protein